eukprot:gene3129-5881_t
MASRSGLLAKIRAQMACGVRDVSGNTQQLHALIIPSSDEHQNEYLPEFAKRRQFVTGFSGSNGTAVITSTKAFLFTDSRYWIQAEQQLSSEWTLMKSNALGEPSPASVLKKELKNTEVVGLDPRHFQHIGYVNLASSLKQVGVRVVRIQENPVDVIWQENNRPLLPTSRVFPLSLEFAGKSVLDKLNTTRDAMQANGQSAVILFALDDIAWLFNLRGSDVECNPASTATLFADSSRFDPSVASHLDGVASIQPYDDFYNDLPQVTKKLAELGKISVGSKCPEAIWCCIPDGKASRDVGPVELLKAVKNDTELAGMRRNAHIRDAVAQCAFWCWLEEQIENGVRNISESDAAAKIQNFREQQQHYVSLSFDSIAGVGSNGAIVHYKPEFTTGMFLVVMEDPKTAALIDADQVFLLDSGAQYLDGTTDVTRTVHFGEPAQDEKVAFTAILKGHISLSTAKFPKGTTGRTLDSICRSVLWRYGLNYGHGTGHGVGSFLNVHEGPMSISCYPRADSNPLEEGNVVTIEPGYYCSGKFGMRIENVVIAVASETVPGFIEFEPVTLVPIQAKMIDQSLLLPHEVYWINEYHAKCREVIGAELVKQGLYV